LSAVAQPLTVDVVVAPSALFVDAVAAAAPPGVAVALQDVHVAPGLGAYTGSHTVAQLAGGAVRWVLVGHSERRSLFAEADAASGAKAAAAAAAGLGVIFCVGESLAEREAGATMAVVARQLAAAAAALPAAAWPALVVAYEPVWAIGTGKVASTEQAQEAHAAIRAWIAEHVDKAAAAATRVIYGGSVTAANCGALSAQPDIDGFLVGGASLKPEFVDIVKAVADAKKALAAARRRRRRVAGGAEVKGGGEGYVV